MSAPGKPIFDFVLLCRFGFVVSLLAALMLAAPASAQQPGNQPVEEFRNAGVVAMPHSALLGLVNEIHLVVEDGVTDGCWTNANAVTNQMIGILASANIPSTRGVEDSGLSPMQPRLDLRVVGRRLEGACLASAQLALYFTNNTQLNFANEGAIAGIRTSQTNIMWITSQAIAGPDNIDVVVQNWINEWITPLANRIASQRVSDAVVQANMQWGFED